MKKNLSAIKAIRFNQELEDAISKQDGDFSKAVRRLCRAGLSGDNPNSYSQVLDQLETIRREIAPIGGNLNQIATAFNSNGHIYSENLSVVHSDLQRRFSEMTGVLKELKHAIYKHI